MEADAVARQLAEPHEALYRLVSFTARDLRRGIQPEIRKWGITGQQFGVLLGAANGSSIAEIADQLLTDPTSAGRIVERMEAANLVERYQKPADRRVVWVRLKPEGAVMVEKYLPKHVERAKEMLSCLSDEESDTLTGLLNKVRNYLRDDVPAATE